MLFPLSAGSAAQQPSRAPTAMPPLAGTSQGAAGSPRLADRTAPRRQDLSVNQTPLEGDVGAVVSDLGIFPNLGRRNEGRTRAEPECLPLTLPPSESGSSASF